MRSLQALVLAGLLSSLTAAVGCADVDEDEAGSSEEASTIDTKDASARAQYDRDVAFVAQYRTTCSVRSSRKRVLVSAFSGTQNSDDNASGRIVEALVPGFSYPTGAYTSTFPILDPVKATSVHQATISLPSVGEVDVCAMVLPVLWDVPAILIAKEAQAFAPDFVLMTGEGGSHSLLLELGSVNRASRSGDASRALAPIPAWYERPARIIPGFFRGDDETGNLLSWTRAKRALEDAITKDGAVVDDGARFDRWMPKPHFAGYPRAGNTYVCNNTTYIVNYLMDHPETAATLHKASPEIRGKTNALEIAIDRDLRQVPRVFLHVPMGFAWQHRAQGASLARALIDAQLGAPESDAPTRGSNKLADPDFVANL